MADEPIDLDESRDATARHLAMIRRRRLQEFEADRDALQRRHDELEELAAAPPAKAWREAAAKAVYLIQLVAETPEGQGPLVRKLIADTLDDIAALSDREEGQT
jgi:hypothetical protein